MKHPKIPGIYAIRHIASDWVYIGSASQIYARWRSHKADLRNNKHGNPHLQNAWNSHGESAFVFEVLEACLKDPVILFHREQVWIDRAKGRLYNCAMHSEPAYGHPISEEQKRASSERMKGNRNGANSYFCGVLTEGKVLSILHAYASGDPLDGIAARFGVTLNHIRRITRRVVWGHLPLPDHVESKRAEREKCRERMKVHPRSKLTREIADQIRAAWAAGGETKTAIGRRFGISATHVRFIVTGKLWAGSAVEKVELEPIVLPTPPSLPPLRKGYRERREAKPRAPKVPRVELSCDWCSKPILRQPCKADRYNRHYCDRACCMAHAGVRMREVMARPGVRERLARASTGQRHTEETRRKMSESQKARASRARAS